MCLVSVSIEARYLCYALLHLNNHEYHAGKALHRQDNVVESKFWISNYQLRIHVLV